MQMEVNEYTSDVTRKTSGKELEPVKPIQHPINLDSQDSLIISHKAPPKALTPYY